ncbi:MAG: tRNA 2-thiocytidine biosynthesis protein TtcA [Spirochaetes bacterium]|nr:tRNA 2-thiocytidine biosynthesis protein TtcA [Spirochaetota bacterium]
MNELEKRISRKIGKIIFEYKMIKENDRILVGVSGGKDSLTLLHDLKRRQKSFPIKYTFEAAHIVTDFISYEKSKIEKLFKEWDIPYHIVFVPVIKRLKENKKMNCYWCSTQRRMELMKLAKEKKFNKIALGHHLDDIVETFLMNIFFKAEIAAMLPVFEYKKYPVTVIRPMARVKEKEIAEFAKEKNFFGLTCSCKYGKNSKRLDIKALISQIGDKYHNLRENIFDSMKNINNEYML